MSTLRDELGATQDPDFEMTLPEGWVRRSPSADDEAAQVAALKSRMMQAHRPDLLVPLQRLVEESFEGMRQHRVIATFSPTGAEGTASFAGSMVARVRHAEPGSTMQDVAVHAIREFGATPLFGDKRVLRFQRESTQQVSGAAVRTVTITYLTPIPGSKQRRALELTASYGVDAEAVLDEGAAGAAALLFDACVATLRWTPAMQEARA